MINRSFPVSRWLWGFLLVMVPLFTVATPLDERFTALNIDAPQQRLPVPPFVLSNLQGESVQIGDFNGKVVLLNFWATFCEPCREEMPALMALWQTYRAQGLAVVAVAVDRGSRGQVEEFVRSSAIAFPVLLDPEGTVRNRYEVRALPTSYLIARDGRFLGRLIGARDWNDAEFRDLIRSLLSDEELI